MSVLVETSLGAIVFDLYCSERPQCCLNFLKLCKMKYYNFCIFHSVQKNLVAQCGDPTSTGRGGGSIFQQMYGEQARYFDAERKPKISHTQRALLSMVDNGYGQHGSQFFITLADRLEYLDRKHTVFGYLSEGLDFIDRMNEVYCDKENRPFRNIRVHHTIVLDDPFETPKGLKFPSSPSRCPISAFTDSGVPRIEEDEELNESADLSPSQLNKLKDDQEARTNAQLLALIGDLPDADVKPPENVLFVCRLNPVTTSEDLEIIFSRFGQIESCEVVQDRRTGASLQYAFIEFETEADCESAYFKMDKVVIDDRRIHVDFSQSVAKEWKSFRQQKMQKTQSVQPIRGGTTRTEYRTEKRDYRPPPPRHQPRDNNHRDDRRSGRLSPSPKRPRGYREDQNRPRPVMAVPSRSKGNNPDETLIPQKRQMEMDFVVSDSGDDGSSSTSSSSASREVRKKKKKKKEKHKKHHHRSRHDDRGEGKSKSKTKPPRVYFVPIMTVHLGCNQKSFSAPDQTPHARSFIQFLYESHQQFDLERNGTETFLPPRDELALFKLVLHETGANIDGDSYKLWKQICQLRISNCSSDYEEKKAEEEVGEQEKLFLLVKRVEALLDALNLVDRTMLVQRLRKDFSNNDKLKSLLHNTLFIIHSPNMEWFEKCPITTVLLSYLGLSVNIKDSIRLLRLVNSPKRGLDRAAFTALRRVATQSTLSAMQVAMSFVCRQQLSFLHKSDSTDTSRLLQPWSAGLKHLVDCVSKCQDALYGALDDAVLVCGGEEDRINLKDACRAVVQCLETAGRTLRKPLIGAPSCAEDAEYDREFTEAKGKQITSLLCEKVKSLSEKFDGEEFFNETPGRALSHGGSLRGRAAFKLARFFLVIGEELSYQQVPPLNTKDEGVGGVESTGSPAPFGTPTQRNPITPHSVANMPTTPTTMGRGDQLVRMYLSPQTPCTVEKSQAVPEVEDAECEAQAWPAPELDDANTMPERPVFARYQTNLDWADARVSPMGPRKTRQSWPLQELNEFQSQSMPAWSEMDKMDQQSRDPSKETTPVKKTKLSAPSMPKALFDKPSGDVAVKPKTSMRASKENSAKGSVAMANAKRSSKGKKSREVDAKQPRIMNFFS